MNMMRRPPDTAEIARERRRPWHAYRREIEATIERLIEILDAIDGDPDLEPSLASPEHYPRTTLIWAYDGEPYRDNDASQVNWARGASDDREVDDGDAPEDPEAVMVLGRAEPDSQRVRRAKGGARAAA